MSVETVQKVFHHEKLSWKEIISYSVSGFGQNLICGLVGSFVMIFYTDVYLVPPMAVAVMMFFARIFDAFNDPIMGSLVDRTRTKWGKLRPYLMFTSLPIAVATILCFCSPNLSASGKIIYISVTYVLWGVLFTIVDVPYWGLSSAMTPDTNERSKLLTVARIFCTGGTGLISLGIPVITGMITNKIKAAHGAGAAVLSAQVQAQMQGEITAALRPAYLYIAIGVAVVGAPLFLSGFFGTRERAPQNPNPPSLRHNLSLLFKNKPLMLILISGIAGSLRFLYLSIGLYVCKYNLQNESLYTVMNVLVAPAGLLASALTPVLSKKIGKKALYIWTNILQSVLLAAMFFAGYDSKPKVLFLGVGIFLLGLPSGFNNIITYAMIGDTVDYLELKTGERAEGICFSMQTFLSKIQMAFSALAVGLTLGAVFYVPNDFRPDSSVLNGIFFMATMGSAISSILCVVPMLFYRFTEKEQKKARQVIDARSKGEAAAAE